MSNRPNDGDTGNDVLIVRGSAGIVLAIGSGVLIGASFVFKKKGLLSSQKGKVAGEGLDYLKSASSMRARHYLVLILNSRLCGGRG